MSVTDNDIFNGSGVTDENSGDVFSFDDVLFGGESRKAEAQADDFDKLLSDLPRAQGRPSRENSPAAPRERPEAPQSNAAQPGSYDLGKFGGAASSLRFDAESETAWLDSSFDENAASAKKSPAQQRPRQTKTVTLGGSTPASKTAGKAQSASRTTSAAKPVYQPPKEPQQASQAPAGKKPAIEYEENVPDHPRAQRSAAGRSQATSKPAPTQSGKSGGGSSKEKRDRISKAILCVAIPVILLCSGYLIYDNFIAPRKEASQTDEQSSSVETTQTKDATLRDNNRQAEPGSEETAVSEYPETQNGDETTTKKNSGLFSINRNNTTTSKTETSKATTAKTEKPSGSVADTTVNDGKLKEKTTKPDKEKETTTKKPSTTKAPETTTTAKPKSDYEYAYAGFDPQPADMSVGIERLLVNRFYILPDGYKPPLGQTTDGSYLNSSVVPHYNAMVKQAAKDGISLIPVSGYRSIETQRANFERKINLYQNTYGYDRTKATQKASEIVLMPRTSEHNAGLAMDFGTNGNYTLDENFANTAAYRWLDQHAAEYGFILRYPKSKQNITYVTYEPWHWRYVGTDLAPKIKASGQVLEEYFGKVNH